MFCLYILKSERDEKLYIGSTKNLERRILEHKNGKVKSTRNRLPLSLVYKEYFASKVEAQNKERYFKGGGKAHSLLKSLIREFR